MNLAEWTHAMTRGRVVDLSKKVTPGGVEGPPGKPKRRYEIEVFTYPPGELMHYISMESHISTHVEVPSHWVPVAHGRPGEDVSDLDVRKFFGIAVLVDCRALPPRAPVSPELLQNAGVREGDIVLVGNCSHRGTDRCYIHRDAAKYLAETKIHMLGIDDTVSLEHHEARDKTLDLYLSHEFMLSNGIPILEQLVHLDDLRTPRFFLMAVPARMGGLESFPVRAIAIELEG